MLNTLVKSPPRKKLLKFAVFTLVGFLLGGLVAYVTNMRAAQQFNEQQLAASSSTRSPSRVSSGSFAVVQENGRLKLVPREGLSKGTEDPSSYKIDMDDVNAAIEASAEDIATRAMEKELKSKQQETAPEVTEEIKALEAAKQQREAFLQAHRQPSIGMYVPGDFSLMDENGNPVTEKSWPGKYLMIFFGFTRCPDVCPVTLGKMAAVLKELGPLADMVQPIFITVDPERDTVEVIKDYTDRFGDNLVGLTGSMEQILAAEASYKVYAAKSERKTLAAEYAMDHTAYIYFMSPSNQLEELFRIEQSTHTVAGLMRTYLMGTAKKK